MANASAIGDSASFRRIAAHWATSISVVTTVDGSGRPFGLTMSAIAPLSAERRQFLICVDECSGSLRAILASSLFGINLLACNQQNISKRFASRSNNKFKNVPHTRHPSSVPMLEGVAAFALCEVEATYPGGDHRIVIGTVMDARETTVAPLLRYRGDYRALQQWPPPLCGVDP